MNNLPILLSILIHGRNDSYMGNYSWRLSTTLNKTAQNICRLGSQRYTELILCDWGSREPLLGELAIDSQVKKMLRVVLVPPEVCRKYDLDSTYSAVHAYNTTARRAVGKYILFSDADNFTPFDTMRNLYDILHAGSANGISLESTFFWGSRYEVPKQFHMSNPSIGEVDRYISENWQSFQDRRIDKNNFLGGAGAILMKKDIWFDCRGFDEKLIYWGWSDIDLHHRLVSRYGMADLRDYNIPFFHLAHYSSLDPAKQTQEMVHKKLNPMNMPTSFAPNDESWGLKNELLPVISWS